MGVPAGVAAYLEAFLFTMISTTSKMGVLLVDGGVKDTIVPVDFF